MADRPIRVLYLDHSARQSGAELALVRLLGALDRTRVEPIVVLAEDGPVRELLAQQRIECQVIPLSASLREVRKDSLGFTGLIGQLRSLGELWRYAKRISRVARQRHADLIYCNSLKADIYGVVAARLAGVPSVWHLHDRIDERYLPRMTVWLVRLLARRLPLCVVANSASTLETLKLRDGGRTAVIACGLTRDFIERCSGPRGLNAVAQIGIVGRLAPWKGQDVFLDAAARLLREGCAARFRIAGSALFGEEAFERRLRARAAELGIREHVEFLGFSDVPGVLRTLDILVHASKLPEPFGQVIIEGLAAGLPVVATDGGGAREIIENGRTGLLVPMGDADSLAVALRELLSRPELARSLAAAGREHVLRCYTIEQSARQSEALYEDLLRAYI